MYLFLTKNNHFSRLTLPLQTVIETILIPVSQTEEEFLQNK